MLRQKKVLILGAGNIGQFIAHFLSYGGYKVFLSDIHPIENKFNRRFVFEVLDASNKTEIVNFIQKKKIDAVISSLPFHCNIAVAEAVKIAQAHYFDLTEDIQVASTVNKLAEKCKKAFVPQCGLAPGFISIAANYLIKKFDAIENVDMRVGALPQCSNNKLRYALTWSTEGLVNEYCNDCKTINEYKLSMVPPLNDVECVNIDGVLYEAFSTSGGLGTLPDSYDGQIKYMNYKTLRYPGHLKYMKFLLNDLKLKKRQDLMKEILENAVPQTEKDVVIIYIAVTGYIDNKLTQKYYVKKIYPQVLNERYWSAIQVATGSSICNVLDLVLKNQKKYHGFVRQEEFDLEDFLENRFGAYYRKEENGN